ncbi:hypothetical protein [Vibrio vulnificus YJ016]|uniref:Uncharacterized protein n=1 Tax=Vibrio vulnificus (strain YJ016) TaxID=196600 RepID=Q7MMX1_VIBVY|nr:hypothetical protein VVMO6_02278 [Vibrio vulnificus MO6-24/O]ALM71616.1 hypothetical protein FORC9_2099 [Vibrio vulnificus]BAC93710.1 hypothetical protein [Vibrio vulnificus YJ016]ANH62582.1 hypothetical protein FORC16_0699 [Vibrio vulnificus]ANN27312.1 hypothetical protein FORC17_2249 [Vibrio vulnificus]
MFNPYIFLVFLGLLTSLGHRTKLTSHVWTGQISQTFFSLKNGDTNNLSHFKINQ